MNVQVSVDYKDYENILGEMKRQTPYILQKAINDTLIEAQTDSLAAITGKFTVRRPAFFKRSVKMIQFAKKDNLTGILGIADMAGKPTADILGKFEEGGTKTPHSGHNVAIPSTFIRPIAQKIVSKGNRPRNLNRSFKIKTNAGEEMLLVRKGRKKNSRTEVAYIFKPSVQIDHRLGFVGTVVKTIDQRFDINVNKWWVRAIETSKPKE